MARTFDPFREMDRLLGDVTRTPASVGMPMDLYRIDDQFVAQIDLPGVDPGSIDIDMDADTVTIRAERQTAAGEGAQWLARERAVGTFARQLTLGRGLAGDQITASYADGVLTLTIPIAEAAKPRKIQLSRSTGTIHGEIASDEGSAPAE
ncbi:MAG TPA: Hsp20/alpha crystallin family protein [Propionibacteriaceae bacterium]|nr:Hsp20/alpha crystallin family protein [Propionibacteriaceae bacterium]